MTDGSEEIILEMIRAACNGLIEPQLENEDEFNWKNYIGEREGLATERKIQIEISRRFKIQIGTSTEIESRKGKSDVRVEGYNRKGEESLDLPFSDISGFLIGRVNRDAFIVVNDGKETDAEVLGTDTLVSTLDTVAIRQGDKLEVRTWGKNEKKYEIGRHGKI